MRITLFMITFSGIIGCQPSDVDVLARVGERVQFRLGAVIPANRKPVEEFLLAQRVKQRLQSDIELADQALTITAKGGVVHLGGTVTDMEAKKRAGNLASTTVGVTFVEDDIAVIGP